MLRGRSLQQAKLRVEAHKHHFEDGTPALQAAYLRNEGHKPCALLFVKAAAVRTGYCKAAMYGQKAAAAMKYGRFTTAVQPQQGAEFAGSNVYIHAMDNLRFAIGYSYIL